MWDEPTLVSFLIVFLLYATYQPLRFAIEDPERQARYASVFAITAGAFVPLNFIAVRLSTAYVHPRVLGSTSNLPGPMALTFLVSLVAMALLFATLCKYELTAKHTRAQLRALRRRLDRRRAGQAGPRRAAQRGAAGVPPARGAARARAGRGRVMTAGCSPSARAAAARGRQVRGRRLHGVVRARADLRGDHGDPPEPDRARAGRAAGSTSSERRAQEPTARRARGERESTPA